MPKSLQIGNTTFNYPEQGDNPGWGEEATAWAEAVTDALLNVQGPNDILLTSATLANDVTTATNISGLQFNVSEVQSVEVDYFIKRIYDTGTTTVVETGKIQGHYDGTEFTITFDTTGDAGVEITVDNSGQFQYTSSDLTNHTSSIIQFRGRTIDQP